MEQTRIAELRHEADLSQKELATKLGIVQSTVSAWESGRNQPDFSSMRQMAQLFHCSIDYLMDKSVKSATRGLSEGEYEAWRSAEESRREEEAFYKRYAREIDGEQGGLTQEEIEEILTSEQMCEWEKVKEDIMFEAFQINDMMENMTRRERQYCLELIKGFNEYRLDTK